MTRRSPLPIFSAISSMGPLLLLITAVLATLVLYFWARKAQLEKQLLEEREENERIMNIAEDLKARLGAASKRQTGRKFDALDRLCEQYYIYEGTDNLQPRILKEVKSIVDGLRADENVRRQLEQALNESSDGVINKLKADFPGMKQEDYMLFLFTASGFSTTTISTLLEKDKPYVYNRLYRLKERLKQSGSAHKTLYLTCLDR